MVERLDNLRIVVVDDHNQVRRALASFLSGLGAIVRECANADVALTIIPHLQPDLVLSDIANRSLRSAPEHEPKDSGYPSDAADLPLLNQELVSSALLAPQSPP